MFRMCPAVAVIAASLGFATEAGAGDNQGQGVSLHGYEQGAPLTSCSARDHQGVSLHGYEQHAHLTSSAAVGAQDATPRAAPAIPLAVEAVILATGETVNLR
jgi:hypothetical protein